MTTTEPKTVIAAEQDAVITEIEIAAPPECVFKALTDPEQLVRWFKDANGPAILWEMDARPGGRYRYAAVESTAIVMGVDQFECHGEIVEIDPPRLLVYTWVASWHEDKTRRTVVRWELSPAADGTRVKVTHSGLAQEASARKDYRSGWLGVLTMLRRFMTESQ